MSFLARRVAIVVPGGLSRVAVRGGGRGLSRAAAAAAVVGLSGELVHETQDALVGYLRGEA